MTAEATAFSGAVVWLGLAALLAVTVGLMILSALLERSGPIRLRHWVEEAQGQVLALYERPVRFEVFRYLLNLIARVSSLALALCTAAALSGLGWARAGAISLATVAAVVAATELLDRTLVARDPEHTLRRLTAVYRVVVAALLPLVLALAPFVPPEAVERREEDEEGEASEEEIEAFIHVGTREGIIEPGEEDLLWRLVDFGDTQVRSVMTPRIDMVAAPEEGDLETVADLFLESKHSRIPVYRGSVDQVVGILHMRDVFGALRAGHTGAAGALAGPALVVPETKPLDELLKEFQTRHQQMAIAVDEYGGTAGLVTVEDIIEEIVGEIFDEHEVHAPHAQRLADGSWRLDGRAPVDLLEELFDVELDGEESYETVGGMIFGLLGYVPEAGASVDSQPLRFTVEKVEDRRIRTVRVERLEVSGEVVGEPGAGP